MTTIKIHKLTRVGQAKRLNKGGLGFYVELLVGTQMVPPA